MRAKQFILESRVKIWHRLDAFESPGGLGSGGSVVYLLFY